MAEKDLTKSRLGRIAKIGTSLFKATGKFAAQAAIEKAEGIIDKKADEFKLAKAKIQASKEIIKSMGELKGALMKIGQMISITEDLILPPEVSKMLVGIK